MTYWFLIRELLIAYHKKYPGYEFNVQRLLYVGIRVLLIYFGVKFALGFLVHTYFHEIHEIIEKNPLTEQLTTAILLAAMFFLYEGIYYFNKSRLIEIEKNKLERLTAEQKLDTLKNQVNPHFLFNSLNTLVTMIPEEPELATEFVQKLSSSYRNILEVRDEKLIPIRQELKALESYIYLLKTRFQGKIHIFNKLDESLMDHFILPLSLQILIENAVKHNITSSAKPLKVEIFEHDNFVVVKNNLQPKTQNYNSTKMGLANIRSRYSLLIHREIVVQKTADEFIVKLPIIENQAE